MLFRSFTYDSEGPQVIGVTSSNPNGHFIAGDTIVIKVNFNESASVTGTPTLDLDLDAGAKAINYISGSGTTTLTFNYTVVGGDDSSRLDYGATNSLKLNSGTILDNLGNAANLTLATPGGSGSLGNNKNLIIDTTNPTAASVTIPASSSNPVPVSWTGGTDDNLSHHNVKLCTDNGCSVNCTSTINTVNGSPIEAPDVALNSNYYACVQAVDLGGNISAYTSSAATVNILGFEYLGLGMGRHVCALTVDKAAYCWGRNDYKQLGDNTTNNSSVPVAVKGGHLFSSVSGGQFHSCGLKADGSAYCWGRNMYGQVGDGTKSDRSSPTAVTGGHIFSKLLVGGNHTCGLKSDGSAYCWGRNDYGQIGDNSNTDRSSPATVSGGITFSSLYVGRSAVCGLESDGSAYCWGHNSSGLIGDGSNTHRKIPKAVSGGHQFSTLGISERTACGIRTDGAGYCWGLNSSGQIGDGTNTNRSSPRAVIGGHSFVSLAQGSETRSHCALKSDGSAFCWGNNSNGGLGDGTETNRSSPVAVTGGHLFSMVNKGFRHSCGIKSNGSVFCWGLNGSGELGNGTNIKTAVPVEITYPTPSIDCTSLAGAWIDVPGDADYGTNDFCLMKYEARNVSGAPFSQPTNAPWNSVSQATAISECQSLGNGYRLINNDEWMTVAANVAGVASNWSAGSVGNGVLAQGHSDNNPSNACESDANDTNAWVDGSCTGSSSGSFDQKRTLNLSNGELIWDLAGNLSEWTTYFNDSDKPTPTGGWNEYSTPVVGTGTTPLSDIIPTSKSYWNTSWNSSEGIGEYQAGTNGSGGALLRGGRFKFPKQVGVFTADFSIDSTYTTNGHKRGFRCVYSP